MANSLCNLTLQTQKSRTFFLFFPCSADHERDWPPCKVVFFELATNALNVRNNNNNNNPSNRATYCSSGVVIPPSSPSNAQSVRVPTTPAHLFFRRKKIPASHGARVGTSTVSLALGANREGKERVKGEASRVQSTRIGSALVCIRRNVQHRELKLFKSTRFALVTVV